MKNKTTYIIAGVTGLLMVYILSVNLDVKFGIIFFLFLMTEAGLCWMVYAILTDDSPVSGKTFDEQYYEDADHKP